METHRDGVGMFIYSLWNSTAWRVGDAGTYCIQFQEDGTGSSCRLDQSPVTPTRSQVTAPSARTGCA